MNPQHFTEKVLSYLREAQLLAQHHSALTPLHLFSAILHDPLFSDLFPHSILESLLKKLPHVSTKTPPEPSPALVHILTRAYSFSQKRDHLVDLSDLLTALYEDPSITSLPLDRTLLLSRLHQIGSPLPGPVIGRDHELSVLRAILSQKYSHSPVLIGPSGVGKTTLIHKLSQHVPIISWDQFITTKSSDTQIIHLPDSALIPLLPRNLRFITESSFDLSIHDPRCHIVPISEPSLAEAIRMVQVHGFPISETILINAVYLAERYLPGVLPGKAISFLDQVISRYPFKRKLSLREILEERKWNLLIHDTIHHSTDHENEIQKLQEQVDRLPAVSFPNEVSGINEEDLNCAIADLSGFPVERIRRPKREILLSLEEEMFQRIIGQREAIQKICRILINYWSGDEMPSIRLIFTGPDGVGKKTMAKALADLLLLNYMPERERPYSVVIGSDDQRRVWPKSIMIELKEEGEGHIIPFHRLGKEDRYRLIQKQIRELHPEIQVEIDNSLIEFIDLEERGAGEIQNYLRETIGYQMGKMMLTQKLQVGNRLRIYTDHKEILYQILG